MAEPSDPGVHGLYQYTERFSPAARKVPSEESLEMQSQQQSQPHFPIQNALGPKNTVAKCTFCLHHRQTKIEYNSNLKTHLMAMLLWVTTCCFCWLPYCLDSCQQANHYCASCGAYLGSFKN